MSIPPTIITCGDNEYDATRVHKILGSEYDIVYAGFKLPETLNEVPLILSDKSPPATTLHTQVASNSFANPILAVVVGGGYSDEYFDELYRASIEACGGTKESLGAIFVRASVAITEKLVAEGKGPKRSTPEYPAAVAQRLRNKLREVGIAPGVENVKKGIEGEIVLY